MSYDYFLLAAGVLFLLIAAYFQYVAFYFSQKSQSSLDLVFSRQLEKEESGRPVNLFYLSNGIPLSYAFLFTSFAVAAIALFLWRSSLSLVWWQVLAIVVAVFVLASLVFVFIVYCAHRNNEVETYQVSPFMLQWLYATFRVARHILPRSFTTYRVEELQGSLSGKKGKTDRKDRMLKGILQFGSETVRDIMTLRMDVVDLDVKTSFADVIKLISENSYSRVPVYSGTKDNIIGVLYIKDLLPYLGKPGDFGWYYLIRPYFAVPETKKIDNLLREFQSRKIHIAVAIDEYGGVSGIVTLEDIIEEIVGEINDEYDDDQRPYVMVGQDMYVFSAKTSLQDFCKLFGLDSDFFDDVEGDADSLAGLLLDLFGDFPKKHDTVTYRQFLFEVLEVDERHISKVKVTLNPADAS